MFLLWLRDDIVCQRVALEQLHHYVDGVAISERVEVFDDVRVREIFKDGHFLTDFFDDDLVDWSLLLARDLLLGLEVLVEFLRGDVEVAYWNFFHCVLALTSLH